MCYIRADVYFLIMLIALTAYDNVWFVVLKNVVELVVIVPLCLSDMPAE